MPIPAPQSMADSIADINMKTFGDAAANIALSGAQSHNSHLARLNIISENHLQAWGNRMVSVDVNEAVASKELLTGDKKVDTGAAIALAQQMMKGAQTTPPVTSG